MSAPVVTVLGGTGFLGRRVVEALLDRGFRIRVASRHPDRGADTFQAREPQPEFLRADILDEASLRPVLDGAQGVVNAVSLYVEHGDTTFHRVHVDAAAALARSAHAAGVERLVQISGIGADAESDSPYIRSRGQGELAVRNAFETATIVRSAVMFGIDDAFLAPVARLLKRFPVFAMFGTGQTMLQPVYVNDVAEAIARDLQRTDKRPRTYELGGPTVLSYHTLLRTILRHLGRKRLLVPVPFFAWHVAAFPAEFLPRPPITRNQIELMRQDNVVSGDEPGFEALGISPRSIDQVLPDVLRAL